MRTVVAGAMLGILLLPACAQSRPAPSPAPTIDRSAGAYRAGDGAVLVLTVRSDLVNLRDHSIRHLFPTSVAGRFTIGTTFGAPDPRQADVVLGGSGPTADRLAITPAGGKPAVAPRIPFRDAEVRVPATGATLAGTVTEPLTPGPHPGIVIVHGSGPGPRSDYEVWVALYASLGLTVLAYDKRGNGASTGQYPGERATEANLDVYADD